METRRLKTPPYRHFERKREIFVILGQADDVWNSQTGNPLPTHFQTLSHLYSAALLLFMRRTAISHFSFLISFLIFIPPYRTHSFLALSKPIVSLSPT